MPRSRWPGAKDPEHSGACLPRLARVALRVHAAAFQPERAFTLTPVSRTSYHPANGHHCLQTEEAEARRGREVALFPCTAGGTVQVDATLYSPCHGWQ